MARGKPRKEFDHKSQGGAWAAESTSDGRDWKAAGEKGRDRKEDPDSKPRRIIAL